MSVTSIDWRLAMCGLNHQTASVREREPLQIGREDIARAHADFSVLPGVLEVVIVSTCNRIEFYFIADVRTEPIDLVTDFYRRFRELDISACAEHFYVRKAKHAADHLFRVAAGVDSMVVGENQILGQVREAYSSACAVKVVGKVMHRLFHQALRTGKQVRTDTRMGEGACSISSAAVELLKSRLKPQERPSVLLVGANRMIELAASRWSRLHHNRLLFANRDAKKADSLARRFKGQSFALAEVHKPLAAADIVITCTGSADPIITEQTLAAASHDGRPMTIVDLAVPRDVAIDKAPGVEVLTLDDLQAFVNRKKHDREAAVPDAEKLIAERLNEFSYWYDHARFELGHNGLEQTFETICLQELQAALSDPEHLDDERVNHTVVRLAKRLADVAKRTPGNNH